jgi:predicted lipoprotein with Yx(FWY)xxD motif
METPIEGDSMTRSRRITMFATAAVALVALVVAGCGSSSSSSSKSSSAPLKNVDASATVNAATTGLGPTLVDSQGHTIYLFKKDQGTKSACFGACASAWPPVRTSGKPTVGGGAKASLVGSVKRSDGQPQVTYNGHPLYLFQGDKKPGDTTGQGITAFGAAWFGLTPSGTQITGSGTSSNASNSSGGLGY